MVDGFQNRSIKMSLSMYLSHRLSNQSTSFDRDSANPVDYLFDGCVKCIILMSVSAIASSLAYGSSKIIILTEGIEHSFLMQFEPECEAGVKCRGHVAHQRQVQQPFGSTFVYSIRVTQQLQSRKKINDWNRVDWIENLLFNLDL